MEDGIFRSPGVPNDSLRTYQGSADSSANALNIASSDPNRIRSISVRQVDNGYVVSVGCQTLVFETAEKLSKYFDMYLKNPQKVEELHFKKELF